MITYEKAKEMKELGLPQKRHKNAKYYVTPEIIMDFEAIHDLKDAKAWFEERHEEQVNWMEHFTYIPELIDLIGPQSYDLTLDAAVYHFIDGKKSYQEEKVAEITLDTPSTGRENDKKTVIADSTLEGLERIKQAIKENATQSPASAI